MSYSAHRPLGYEGQGDLHLGRIVRQLQRTLAEAQRDFSHDTLRLDAHALGELASILVEFAEDLYSRGGIWEAYERYNKEFFGTALPLTLEQSDGGAGTGFGPDRFRHFLWVSYPMLLGNLTLSPTHHDLQRVADASIAFLSDAFSGVPRDFGVKAFLRAANPHGWDIKRKLVWLGTHSFMFRLPFARYMDQQAPGGSDIAHTDDFVCQECTRWSGLGAIDVLAVVLDISEGDRTALRSWCERHTAFYRLVSVSKETLQAVNLVSDQRYRIRIDTRRHPFRRGQVIFGSLVPWRGEWYWSGEQRLLGDASKVDVNDLKRTMKRHSPAIVCRYSKEHEALVRQRMAALHEQMLSFHGGQDLVVYPDGLSMAADWQKEIRWQWESRPQQEVDAAVRKHGLKKGRPEMKIPEDLLEEKDGLGVFLSPDEGKEIMTHFTTLIAGLTKKGNALTAVEEETIRGFFNSPAISPRFVRRVLEEYGEESVKAAFLLRGDLPGYWLDCLLRSHKGHFYRKRYPSLSVV